MKKALFIDRDGTIIWEPPTDWQIDSLEKLEFTPSAIRNLYKIRTNLDYEFVMVTNQDGLGTEKYPKEAFDMVQSKMIKTLLNEGVVFDAMHVDEHFEHENHPNRKPNIGMLTSYLSGDYDLAGSYVIGDRRTDMLLAKNMGCKGIFIKNYDEIPVDLEDVVVLATNSWDEIWQFLRLKNRTVSIKRKTAETEIDIFLNLDSTQKSEVSTGLSFLDHMLDQIARHGNLHLKVNVKGDLHVDEHHTVEDTAIVLGEVFLKALGDKLGMERYGFCLPMDDCLAQVAIDFGGRPWLVWDAYFKREKIGDVPTEMFKHFFKSFSDSAKCNLNIKAEGENEHHKIESIFKAFAKAVKMAKNRDAENMILPSTKGLL
ncbi:MAG: bifunctional histidinol-phosphatase/imidazoleglycerol-phosphate dehydratase HisB [Flavobacteriales bacterium]